ncbi:hypothetical protein HDU67_002696, partial [Dinochytrium kinnereticum]
MASSTDTGDVLDDGEGRPLLRSTRSLRRSLKPRHIIMMSVGGTIGTGIFIASGLTIATAGPGGALLAYCIVGVM